MTTQRLNSVPPITRYTLTLSLAELGLGSVIHGLQLPLGGHLLSLNQGLILTFANRTAVTRREALGLTTGIANSAAILKALSPAGKRLTPMLAIGTQGLLFAGGVGTLGATLPGVMLGGVLLSVWGFLQPLLIAYLLFGTILFEAALKLWNDTARALGLEPSIGISVLLAIVALKAVLAATLSVCAWLGGETFEARYLARIDRIAKKAPQPRKKLHPHETPLQGAWRDLLHPWFLASFVLGTGFFLMSGPDGAHQAAWYALRTLAVGLLFFWVVRALPRRWFERLKIDLDRWS